MGSENSHGVCNDPSCRLPSNSLAQRVAGGLESLRPASTSDWRFNPSSSHRPTERTPLATWREARAIESLQTWGPDTTLLVRRRPGRRARRLKVLLSRPAFASTHRLQCQSEHNVDRRQTAGSGREEDPRSARRLLPAGMTMASPSGGLTAFAGARRPQAQATCCMASGSP